MKEKTIPFNKVFDPNRIYITDAILEDRVVIISGLCVKRDHEDNRQYIERLMRENKLVVLKNAEIIK